MSDEPLIVEPVAEAVAVFLAGLPASDPNEYLAAPGVGLMQARHLTRGLKSGALQVHRTGRGLAWTAMMQDMGNGRRAPVLTSAAAALMSEVLYAEHRSPPASRARVSELMVEMRRMTLGLSARKAAPDPLDY